MPRLSSAFWQCNELQRLTVHHPELRLLIFLQVEILMNNLEQKRSITRVVSKACSYANNDRYMYPLFRVICRQ